MGADKLAAFRALFKSPRVLAATSDKPISAYVLPSTDAHNSEYLADVDFRVKFFSGFTGSNAYVVVTNNDAFLWTDGRYFLQADKQLYPGWKLQKQGVAESVTPIQWMCSNLASGDTVGFDPELLSFEDGTDMIKQLNNLGIRLIPIHGNLVDEIWNDRPKLAAQKLLILDKAEAGETIAMKIKKIRADLIKSRCTGGVFTFLDDIMWFLNVRGFDLPHNPLAYSYLFVDENDVHLFIDDNKLNDEIRKHLHEVVIHKYEDIISWLTTYHENRKKDVHYRIFVPTGTNYAIGSIFSQSYGSGTSPIQTAKAVKNTIELEGTRKSHIRDSAALVEFFVWLEKELKAGKSYTEIELASKIDGLRATYPKYVDLSFSTISAGGDHAALPHYHPEGEEGQRKVHADAVYLLDSGAHYRDGTTDVTRTIFVNTDNAPKELIEHNTLVLKGHINLAMTIFPSGIEGIRLDSFTRHTLWQHGLDFGHGTGHGVGYFLNVHEGPAGIGFRLKYAGIQAGMIMTIEPGYYLPGKWGIRIENCYEVTKIKVSSGAQNFLTFAPLTLVPIQTAIINRNLLSTQEINWLNSYHDQVLSLTGDYLKNVGKMEEYAWLAAQCKHI